MADIQEGDELHDLTQVLRLRGQVRKPKTFKERRNFFRVYDPEEFYKRFRLPKYIAVRLFKRIKHQLQFTSKRNRYIRPSCQFLATLRLLATGSFLITIGDFAGFSTASMCRVARRVIRAILTLRQEFITMPSTPEEIRAVQQQFFRFARFPRCVGALDCTHIRLQSPGGSEAENYRCRKGFFSLNVQIVSGPNAEVYDIVARWPGATHDQTIFNNSRFKRNLQNGRYGERSIIVADGGYQNTKYVATPLLPARNRAEELYNESQIRTRNVVERLNGILKRRFPILSVGSRFRISFTMEVIVACAVLHNICVAAKETNVPDMDEEVEALVQQAEQLLTQEEGNIGSLNGQIRQGNHVREELVSSYFSTLM